MLPILYRDAHLVAIHKPSGLLVHRSGLDRHERRFAVQMLRDQIGQRVYPAHRLDKGTSGVLLFALDEQTAGVLGAAFRAQRVHKTYLAIVRGHPPEEGLIDHPLSRRPDEPEDTAGAGSTPRLAQTRFRRLAVGELPHRVDRYPASRYALLELEPMTGRRHQLRRHLEHIAHPVIGDSTFGKGAHNRLFQTLFGVKRLLLACVELRLRHPATGQPLAITAPLAEDFAAVVHGLGWESTADRLQWRRSRTGTSI
jgi:tRNA pseudouridine65 synthase